jgi:2-hydroxychromene-2-carboxylate isomerase
MSAGPPDPADGLPLTRWPAGAPGARDADTADGPPVPAGTGPAAPGGTSADPTAGEDPPPPADEGPPAFFFDFRDPESYLAAERVLTTLPVATPWVPIDSARLPSSSWDGFRCETDEAAARDRITAVAAERGLQPLRWPAEVPFDSRLALLAAWYAKGIGRVVSFALPAFRQAYAGGHDLSTETPVLLAASACEMHPRAVVQAFERPAIARALADATDRAIAAGVLRTPAVWTGDAVFHGDDGLDEAAAHLAPRAAGG